MRRPGSGPGVVLLPGLAGGLRGTKRAAGQRSGCRGGRRGPGGRRGHDVDGGGPDVIASRLGDVEHHHRHVVRGARLQRQFNQQIGAFGQVLRLPNRALHDVAGHVIQAVRAQQPAFSGLDSQGVEIQLRAGIDVPQHTHQDVLVRMRFGLFRAQAALVDEPLDKGVVDADLFELAVAQAVGP